MASMDFKDTPEDAAFRSEVRAWLDANATPLAAGEDREIPMFTDGERDDDVGEQQAWQKKLFDAGWGVITWPKEFGGREATPMQNFIFRQEMGRYDVPSSEIYLVPHGMVGPTIITHGTSEQTHRCDPEARRGLRDLVPALERAGRRLRPRVAADEVRAGHVLGRLDPQRTEGLDDRRAVVALGPDHHAHRSGPAEAPRAHRLRRGHARAGRDRRPAAADHRRRRLQRGVLRRRPRTGRPAHRRHQRRLARRDDDADVRAVRRRDGRFRRRHGDAADQAREVAVPQRHPGARSTTSTSSRRSRRRT